MLWIIQKLSIYYIICLTLFSCREAGLPIIGGCKYASLLNIEEQDSFTMVNIVDPWDESRFLQRYILVPRTSPLPTSVPNGTIIRIPLQRAAVTTSAHACLLTDLNAENSIAALFDSAYLFNPRLKCLMKSGDIADGGSSVRPSLEHLGSLQFDAVLSSPLSNAGTGIWQGLQVPVIACVDYMERSPLGRAEWMKFYGRLFGRGEQADSLFLMVERAYMSLCEKVKPNVYRPTVFCDVMQVGGTWMMPGGDSYLSRVFADAGARYIFSKNAEKGSISMSFEYVIQQARNADVWLIKTASPLKYTYQNIAEEHPTYREFKAWKEQCVFHCNTLFVPYFEETSFHPDKLLYDLIGIFHPKVIEDFSPHYFHPL